MLRTCCSLLAKLNERRSSVRVMVIVLVSVSRVDMKPRPCCLCSQTELDDADLLSDWPVDISRSCTAQEVSVVEHTACQEARPGSQGQPPDGGQRSRERPPP